MSPFAQDTVTGIPGGPKNPCQAIGATWLRCPDFNHPAGIRRQGNTSATHRLAAESVNIYALTFEGKRTKP
jgi:hypothetical protein